MTRFSNNISARFKQSDLLIKLISINVAIFILFAILELVSKLFKLPPLSLHPYISLSADLEKVLFRPWTLITYMFVHYDLFHILFNMIILYGFGRIFLSYFSIKNLGGVYILGGLAGAFLYILAFNTIPYYIDFHAPSMIGASAAVSAVIFASACYKPNLEINIFFLKIKIIYIAAIIFILDCIDLGSETNPGGSVAHIGGALLGYIFALQYAKGKDITKWLNKFIDSIVNLFKAKPRNMKVKYKRPESDAEYNQRTHETNIGIDVILDKIKESGYSSLSKEEKKRLFDASNK